MFHVTRPTNVLLAANRLVQHGYWQVDKMERALQQLVDVNNVKPVQIGEDLQALLEEIVKAILISDVPEDAHGLVVILNCSGIYNENAGTVRVGKGGLKLRIDPALSPHFTTGDVVIGFGQGVFE
ncbi:hypothetical protein A2572_03670 [Candidatus Collierbacteria bacterium RIFOXYD1_FULL_40_9]|uniref:Uncharacterized protein n=1 Tax=Candidatus Collierbacteria bacterium RIFOXYD1_FULL_40_9 TaxID=1817731 RepID=A0A1F5FTL9_9BACT|nr:MAG: hypothetical protein A2572_03670 [Candidatus Collierbacteria bacterium RIFOXYD1_FULL_40_9]